MQTVTFGCKLNALTPDEAVRELDILRKLSPYHLLLRDVKVESHQGENWIVGSYFTNPKDDFTLANDFWDWRCSIPVATDFGRFLFEHYQLKSF